MSFMARKRGMKNRKPTALPQGFVEVDNPYFQRGYAETKSNVRKIPVAVGNDVLWGMLSRNQIDRAQFDAGREYQRIYERATIGGVKAIDPGKVKVDVIGHQPAPPSNDVIDAESKLKEIRRELGPTYPVLLLRVLGEGESIAQLAARSCKERNLDFERKYLGRQFKEALECLADLWGLTTRR